LPHDLIVTSVKLKLIPKSVDEIEAIYKKNLEDRKKHQPLQYASFGSVFKNPDSNLGSAGKLIESLGLKGYQIGQAMISPMHANWIVNPNKQAKTSDMIALMEHAQHQVKLRCGIDLEPEVIRW
jgi:UDP-N-acetylmuramate dehydrogenase